MAMTRELVNTPGRLAYVKPHASTSWAAIKHRKQAPKHVRVPNAQSAPRPRLGQATTTSSQTQAEPSGSLEDGQRRSEADSLQSSYGDSDADDVSADTMRSTVKFEELIDGDMLVGLDSMPLG